MRPTPRLLGAFVAYSRAVTDGSRKTVLAAFFANLGIAISKLVGFLLTGSASLLAETVIYLEPDVHRSDHPELVAPTESPDALR